MSNSQGLNDGFFIPNLYDNPPPISNAPISNAHIQAATTFQDKNSISAVPQLSNPAGIGYNTDSSHVVDFLVEAAQEAAKEAAKGEAAALEASQKARWEEFQLTTDAKTDAKIKAAMEEINEIIRRRNSTQTENLNGALSRVPAAIEKEVRLTL